MTLLALLRRAVPIVVIAVVAAVLVPRVGGPEPIVATAAFDDVRDLVTRAHVRVADVPVGTVTSIRLTEDHRALVTMEVSRGTGLPDDVVAVLRATSVLGERYVELRPVTGAEGTFDGGRITRTEAVRDVEDLVASGSDLLGLVAADRLARAVSVGATALGGRGGVLGATIGDVEQTVAAYAGGREDLGRLIDASDRLLADLAPDAEASAAVLDDLDRAARAFDRQDERLFTALQGLSRLARVGTDILTEHGDSLDALLTRLHLVAAELTRIDGALQSLLTWLPRHNLHIANGVVDDQAQVWNDFTVCGIDDEPENPANSCDPPNPGRSNDPPPGSEADACDDQHEGCPYGDAGEGRR